MSIVIKRLLLLVCLALLSQHGWATPTAEMALFERSQVVMQRVVEFAKLKKQKLGKAQIEGAEMTRMVVEIEHLLSQEKNPAVLARVAVLTRVHLDMERGAGVTKDETVGMILVESWIGCMTSIKKLGGSEALVALDDLKLAVDVRALDGAEARAYRLAREEVEQGIDARSSK